MGSSPLLSIACQSVPAAFADGVVAAGRKADSIFPLSPYMGLPLANAILKGGSAPSGLGLSLFLRSLWDLAFLYLVIIYTSKEK